MAMERYSAFHKALAFREPYRRIVHCHIQDTCWGDPTPLQRSNQRILLPQPTGQASKWVKSFAIFWLTWSTIRQLSMLLVRSGRWCTRLDCEISISTDISGCYSPCYSLSSSYYWSSPLYSYVVFLSASRYVSLSLLFSPILFHLIVVFFYFIVMCSYRDHE